MGDKAMILARRCKYEAYRESQHTLARQANDSKGDPLVKAIARATRKAEKKELFGVKPRVRHTHSDLPGRHLSGGLADAV
jgi:hypothetical protein